MRPEWAIRMKHPPPESSTWEGVYQDDHRTIQIGPEHLLAQERAGLPDECVNEVAPAAYAEAGLV